MNEIGKSQQTKVAQKGRATPIPPKTHFPAGATRPFWRQGTTWAGVLTVGAAVATGGVAALTNPVVIAQICSGVALILAKE